MNTNIKTILKSALIIGAFSVALHSFAAWTMPTATPPGNNTQAPINVSYELQSKAGPLVVGAFRSLGAGIFDDTLTTVGSVGIGTTTPGAKLEVNGQVKITGGTPAQNKVLASDSSGLASWKDLSELGGGGSGDGIWFRDSSGIIKPITPNDKIWLGFDSIIYKSNTSANNNVVKFLHNTGGTSNTNTFLGKGAGNGASITGNGNTGLGYTALEAVSSGGNNTAIGGASMKITTTGSENTAVGANTLLNNTTGSQNTVVGSNAGISSNSISNATAIGHGATVNMNNKVRIGNSAVSVIEGQVDWSFPSDRRIKENIKDVDLGLQFVNSLRPVSYQRIDGDDRINYGFIAQEVEELLDGRNTSIVMTDTSADKMKTMSYTQMIAPMVKAIQEQQKQIEDLKKEIELLKSKN
jgi:hypothetical protein